MSCFECEIEWCKQYQIHWYCFKEIEKKMESEKMFKKLQTIDYDFDAKHQRDKISLEHVIAKIKAMPCCEGITQKPSDSKGVHLILECTKVSCDMCRLLYDDPVRYAKDLKRPTYAANVLFQKKHIPITQQL